MSGKEKIIITIIGFLVISYFILLGLPDQNQKRILKEKTTRVVEVAPGGNTVLIPTIELVKVQLQTLNKGDILETRWEGEWEGSSKLLVVVAVANSKDAISYTSIGILPRVEFVNDLSKKVVRVYRVDTPEWKEKALQFIKQK